ncbi:adenine phosphoribosyltransferase [Desulforhopalus singaporensis]|uniref:Adenine phosphoribosyltransferase n=1 Tax=Desulforhopalus singaporensis TaxID=91360 RepID=A0A1H0TQ98_9BACT|nr:adenine phosphoribosyltransferase [Desulforhopalus singaporensis]SDP56001.1 adenine phosphoribosyltransferase [Desulforhopalus singaporensis]
MNKQIVLDLRETVRTVPGWPIEGVLFRDLTTLMKDPHALRMSCDILFERYKEKKIDKVVGIDARGFVFGAVLAYKLGVGFVPVRKKGKLPYETLEKSYDLEYGSGTLEVHRDAISAGDKVVVVDDLIATGGTVSATVGLVRELGGEVIECSFLIELPDLKGREKLVGCPVFAVMEFDGE